MLSIFTASVSFAPTGLRTAPVSQTARATVTMETAADLKALAEKANPILGYWDPMNLVEYDQWSQGQEASIGFLRHAEIKHGRIAMAAFVGYIVQANGACFPWDLTGDGTSFADISAAGGPADQWDALPTASKLQILGFVGFLELWGENSYVLGESGEKHYMRGGKPGFYPSFGPLPHPVPLDLWDPFGFTKKLTEEQKATKLITEINNGRLAMVGIMGIMTASKGLIVPGLDSLPIPQYGGEIMAPFAASDGDLPFITEMLSQSMF